ncbi:MAG: copper homeostasis protein CutC [Bacteroidia bacterium]|nr:copper homeostasis protein CutC [Bacteroidia bacterium]
MIKLEIACNSFASCLNAYHGGANRIELFENLTDGGCTPSAGTIKQSLKLGIPIYVMIRPRGGDFVYSNDEIDILLADIDLCKSIGVNGIVFGCLTPSSEIDKDLCRRVLNHWGGPATFHRSIDRTSNLIRSAKTLIDLGFERILSSGGQVDAVKGIPALKEMNSQLGSLITIMPGAGINATNATHILKETGCLELHATCKTKIDSNSGNSNSNLFDSSEISSLESIQNLSSMLNNFFIE